MNRILLAVALFSVSFSYAQTGINLEAIDKSADPCENFYQYACGAWLAKHPIPADQASWGLGEELAERNLATLRELLEDSAKHPQRSELDRKLGAYYSSCMDEEGIEKLGIQPLEPELKRIAAIQNKEALIDEIARLHQQKVEVLFPLVSQPDPKNAKMVSADLDQGGIGLPDKDFYFKTDEVSQGIRKKYLTYIETVFQGLGDSQAAAEKKAQAVLKFETALAKDSLDNVSRRNPQLVTHILTRKELEALSPSFDFNRYLKARNLTSLASLNVDHPPFVKAFETRLKDTSWEDWQTYLAFHLVSTNSNLLPKRFADATFEFYSRTLAGVAQQPPRWKRCVNSTDARLGEALGQKFVDRTFGKEGKQRTLEMVADLQKALAKDIDGLTWMTTATKQEALRKLQGVVNKIGYPDKPKTYESVQIAANDALGNSIRARQYEIEYDLGKIGKPTNRYEWDMTAPTVNAYYNPLENTINFPAGILQPPYFSTKFNNAVNFGAAGAIIGHELTHGFDDQGRQFDAGGNLRDWWTKKDAEEFDRRAKCIVNEYSQFSPVPGVKLNGELTLGENVADSGGLRLSYMALMNLLEQKNANLLEKRDGYTAEQRFFVAYGQSWCTSMRDEFVRTLAASDPHSPPKYRVNGVVSNTPEFQKAFGCKVGQPMVSGAGCRVW